MPLAFYHGGLGLGTYAATTQTWPKMIQTNTTASVISSTTLNDVFNVWVDNSTQVTNARVWTYWADDETYNRRSMEEYERQQRERQQRHARELSALARHENAALERKHQERERRVAEAKQRAEELLLKHLTPAQRADYLRSKWFIVEGRAGERFKVHSDRGVHGNITRLEGEREIERLCFRAQDAANVPHHDHLLTQKLMLQHHVEEVLRTAGRTRLTA